ncbi:hypothetical protein GCM10009823_25150 [Brevibacterium salitolerans]|uniref:Secreted protein n=1 Tax=Brevibacterium salitolerans TaxID=1403566 RepID=A0ABN2X0M1_9MICO
MNKEMPLLGNTVETIVATVISGLVVAAVTADSRPEPEPSPLIVHIEIHSDRNSSAPLCPPNPNEVESTLRTD